MRFHIGLSLNWKTIKKWLIPIVIGIALFLGYSSMTVNAATVSNILYGVKNVTVNGTTSNQVFANSSSTLPLMLSQTDATSSFALNTVNFSFTSPVAKSGSSYVITLTYNINFTDAVAYLLDDTVTLPNSFVRFEQGSVNSQSQLTTVTKNSGNSFTVKHNATVSLNSTASLSSIVVYLTGGPFLGCDPIGIQPSQTCPANGTIPIQLTVLNIDVTISEDPNTAILGGIQQEQEKTNDKLDETNDKLDDLKEQQEESNKNQEEIKDAITDSTVDKDTGNDFFNNFSTEDNGGISGIITAPLTLINSLLDNQGTCTDLEFEVWGKKVALPSGCMFWDKVPESLVILLQTIFCGPAAYFLLTKLFKDINNLKDPNKSEVSTLDL